MKGRQSPIRPLIAGLLLGILGVVGIKIGSDQLNASIDAYEKLLKAKDMELDKALEELNNRVTEIIPTEIDVDNGYTQLVSRMGSSLGNESLTDEALQSMDITSFQEYAEDAGFGQEFWESSGANGGDSFKLLKSMISENPNLSVKEFFAQSGKLATKMSGQTLKSPFGLKKGIGQLMIKAGKKAVSKATKAAISKGVAGYTVSGIAIGGGVLPTALVGGIFAAGAGAGLLTVAAIRKFKGNRQKLLLSCIDALSDIEGPRPKVETVLEDETEGLVDDPNIDFDENDIPQGDDGDNVPGGDEFDPREPEQDEDVGPDTDSLEGCEQDVYGLTQFMKKYDKDKDFTNKPGAVSYTHLRAHET